MDWFFHWALLYVCCEEGADLVWVDVFFDWDDDVGRHEFDRVDEDNWLSNIVILDPKSDDVFVLQHCMTYPDTAFGKNNLHHRGSGARHECKGKRRDDDNDCEEVITKEYTHEREAQRDHAERPVPIRRPFYMLVLLRMPTQRMIMFHVRIISPRSRCAGGSVVYYLTSIEFELRDIKHRLDVLEESGANARGMRLK